MSKIRLVYLTIKGLLLPWSTPFEQITDAVLKPLNALGGGASMQKIRKAAETALAVLTKYAGWCPAPWRNEFDAIVAVVSKIADVLEDGMVGADELAALVREFKDAYRKWNED